MMQHYTDEEVIEGLRRRENRCIKYLYQEYFPVIRHYLKQNSGTDQDAEDLFQDTIIVLYKRCLTHPFTLQCSLKTFFMAVCKNLWLQRLDYKYRLLYQDDNKLQESQPRYTMDEEEVKLEVLEMQRLFYKNLMMLPNECRRLLQLYCLKISYKQIAYMMNLKDETYVKTRKYSCKNLLRKRIMKDPESLKIIDYDGRRNNLRLD